MQNFSRKLFINHYVEFGRYAIFAAGAGHFAFLIVFYSLGVLPLVVVNIVSVIIYAYCLKALDDSVERSDYTLIGWLVYTELSGHAILASYYIGTYSGFHYYIVLLSALPFLTFTDPRLIRALKIIFIVVVFVILDTVLRDYPPPYVIDTEILYGLRVFNVTTFITSIILVSLLYAKITYEIRLQLELTSTTDSLTGLYNRRLFIKLAEIEMSKIRRESTTSSLILLDLDDFKRINDQLGHQCGDLALVKVTQILQHSVRPRDILCRWGGEEFIVLLPDTNINDATLVAERIRLGISMQPMSCKTGEFTLTTTLGLTDCSDPEISLDRYIEQADKALYLGKANGKNQYIIAE
ncbi:MAG: GGDEF domain-containing protein [Candidatus Thiodiazotropha sp. 'RUGA']|nr:GGDEF domain-containing protein [Candidatus Thiodiazotropha sp. 'RUGA']